MKSFASKGVDLNIRLNLISINGRWWIEDTVQRCCGIEVNEDGDSKQQVVMKKDPDGRDFDKSKSIGDE